MFEKYLESNEIKMFQTKCKRVNKLFESEQIIGEKESVVNKKDLKKEYDANLWPYTPIGVIIPIMVGGQEHL